MSATWKWALSHSCWNRSQSGRGTVRTPLLKHGGASLPVDVARIAGWEAVMFSAAIQASPIATSERVVVDGLRADCGVWDVRSGIADNNCVAVERHQYVELERVVQVQHTELVLRAPVPQRCDTTCLGPHLVENRCGLCRDLIDIVHDKGGFLAAAAKPSKRKDQVLNSWKPFGIALRQT